MKQHKVIGLKNVTIHIVAQTAGVFYSTVNWLVTGCEFIRASIQIHHRFVIPIHTGPYVHSHPVSVFQINFSGSQKGGTQHRR